MPSPLDNLVATGALHAERPDRREFEGLVRSGRVRLADARRPENSLESRFDLAYNAAHALALAALRHAGYRAANRYVVFQALPHTLGMSPGVWRVLARAHQVRNQSEYEGDLNVDVRFVTDVIAACTALQDAVATLPPVG